MRIEDQVCSFEQAKKLVKLGVILDTQWCWIRPTTYLEYKIALRRGLELSIEPPIATPTVAELGILLPYTHPDNSDCRLVCVKGLYDFTVFYEPLKGFPRLQFIAVTEAQARTEALIWLIENHYISAKDLKL
jgi:hypothetical protein